MRMSFFNSTKICASSIISDFCGPDIPGTKPEKKIAFMLHVGLLQKYKDLKKKLYNIGDPCQ